MFIALDVTGNSPIISHDIILKGCLALIIPRGLVLWLWSMTLLARGTLSNPVLYICLIAWPMVSLLNSFHGFSVQAHCEVSAEQNDADYLAGLLGCSPHWMVHGTCSKAAHSLGSTA